MPAHTFSLWRLLLLFAFLCSAQRVWAQNVPIAPDIQKQTHTFAVKDSTELELDVYRPANAPPKSPCVIFVFGGGFITGSRDQEIYNTYFNALTKQQYVVVSISYRLGLKGVKKVSALQLKPLRRAIDMSVEDLYDATNWVRSHADELGIDPNQIILSGSSAGAITVLQGDYEQRNRHSIAARLPQDFQYAGVVSFSGAILSYNGALKYKVPPAPTMLFHGTEDRLVMYNKARFFNKGFYGSNHIARVFRKKSYPYYFFRVEGMGHEISYTPMSDKLPLIIDFLDEYVRQKRPLQIEQTYKDPQLKPTLLLTPGDLYK